MLYANRDYALCLKTTARALVENELSFDNRLRKMEAVYHDLLFDTRYGY